MHGTFGVLALLTGAGNLLGLLCLELLLTFGLLLLSSKTLIGIFKNLSRIGLLGVKEIINRMQLTLDSIGLYTTGTGYLINLVLNGFANGGFTGGFVAPIQQANGVTSSLAQIALNTTAGITVTGGESVYAFYSNPTGVTTANLSGVRDLGNSILGGGTANTIPTGQAGFYPDGPDILYVVATPLTATSSTILARINWKEAQA